MDFCEQKIEDFVSQLSSKEPVPGGGGVSALTGALAAALAQMVCSLTVGKKKYADVEAEIISVSESLERIGNDLLLCMKQDADAFVPLSQAYSLPKDTEEELKNRNEVLEKCLGSAALPPLHICELVAELPPLIKTAAEKGSTLAVSDAGCGAALAEAAIKSAALNVTVNTRLMKDRKNASELEVKVDALLGSTVPALQEIYKSVSEKLH